MECEVGRIGGSAIAPSTDIGLQDIIELVGFPIPESTRIDNADCAVVRQCSPLPPSIIDSGCGGKVFVD